MAPPRFHYECVVVAGFGPVTSSAAFSYNRGTGALTVTFSPASVAGRCAQQDAGLTISFGRCCVASCALILLCLRGIFKCETFPERCCLEFWLQEHELPQGPRTEAGRHVPEPRQWATHLHRRPSPDLRVSGVLVRAQKAALQTARTTQQRSNTYSITAQCQHNIAKL